MRGLCAWIALACGAACFPSERPVADNVECADGSCVCSAGFGNCDGEPQNGCETVVAVDVNNCGACGVRCQNGYCDDGACICDEAAASCDGKCVALATDPRHCGECGRDCLAGSCSDGRCTPAPLAVGFYVGAMTLDEDQIYLCDYQGGTIVRLGLDGGAGEILATDEVCDDSIAVSGDRIVWSVWLKDDEAMRMLGPGGITTLGVAQFVGDLRANDQHILWAEDQPLETRLRHSSAGQTPTTLHTTVSYIDDVALAGDHVAWIESDADMRYLYYANLALSPPTQLLATADELGAVAIVDDLIYITRCPPPDQDCDDERFLLRLPVSGGVPEIVVQVQTPMIDLVVDGDALYWTEGVLEFEPDRIVRFDPVSMERTLLTQFQDVSYLAASSRYLVWYDVPSRIFTLAK